MNLKTITLLVLAAASILFSVPARGAELPAPVKSVYDHYMKIHAALAAESMKGVAENARAIAKTVRADESKPLSPAIAQQADTLAQANELAPAREAFKSLSNSLIKYLAENKAPGGAYHEIYCPMARASWLQTNKDVSNPYMGKEMSTCGVIKN